MRIQKMQTNPYQTNKKETAFKSHVLAEIRVGFDQAVDTTPLIFKTLTKALKEGLVDTEQYVQNAEAYAPQLERIDNTSITLRINDITAQQNDIKKISGTLSQDEKSITWDA